jgi:signal transduction histidine kinase
VREKADDSPSTRKNATWLSAADRERISAVFCAETACFSDLVAASGLNPKTDFRFSDLSSVDFRNSDIRGYDFTGANLVRTRWYQAKWDTSTIVTDADLTDAVGYGSSSEDLFRAGNEKEKDVIGQRNGERDTDFKRISVAQGQVLDHLADGVITFDGEGRVRLMNPAFVRMWQLPSTVDAEQIDIDAVIDAWSKSAGDEKTWGALRFAVTAGGHHNPIYRRIERNDGAVVDCRTVRMPDGATLVTFQDVTDSVNVERVLTERNQALVEADRIKIDFVRHVSNELRSPLTNIIGFAHFLGDPETGPLTPKQDEYLGYITASSNALLAIINDILDLASIDAGAMVLKLEPVDVRATMDAAAEGVQDRLVNGNIKLDLNAPANIGSFVADERRVRQILFNLLSNAIGFSPPGETVTLTAARTQSEVTFTVTDHGPGIASEIREKVFELFETHNQGTSHRGAGLGLSIVRSFVELHHGKVCIDTAPGQGTTVTCAFPLAMPPL